MTPLTIQLAYANWLAVHQAVHGPLLSSEVELLQEFVTFLTDVAREVDACGCDEASLLAESGRLQENL